MGSTFRVEQKLSLSIKTVSNHNKSLVIKIHKINCCSLDSHIVIQNSVPPSRVKSWIKTLSGKLLIFITYHMRELQLLQWRLLQVDFERQNGLQVWKYLSRTSKIFLCVFCGFFLPHAHLLKIEWPSQTRFPPPPPHHAIQSIPGGDTRYLQISGLQSNTFLTDLMSMVEGEEVRNDIVMMMMINRQMEMMMSFQEGVVSNGTGQGGGEEEDSDVILCHKHEGEQFIVFRSSSFS